MAPREKNTVAIASTAIGMSDCRNDCIVNSVKYLSHNAINHLLLMQGYTPNDAGGMKSR